MLSEIVKLLKTADYKTLRFIYIYLVTQNQIKKNHKTCKGEQK